MSTLLAAARYEYRMQLGKRALWAVTAALGALLLLGSIPHWAAHISLAGDVGIYAEIFNILVPVVVGALLADRAVRDRQLHVVELLDSLPAGPSARLWGKYLGAVAACLLPLLAVWTAALVRFAVHAHTWRVVPIGLGAFAAIELPALLFVGAFALAVPTVIGAPLFRVLFIGYWFWGNLITGSMMPTLSATWLAPLGDHARLGLFGGGPFADAHSYGGASQTAADGLGSIALLLAVAALALTALSRLQARRRTAQ